MALPDWVVITGVVGGCLATLISAMKARPEAKKMHADGAAALTSSAGAIVASVQEEMKQLRNDLAEMRAWRARIDRRMRIHGRWDDQVVAVTRAAGIEIPDPPKLYDEE